MGRKGLLGLIKQSTYTFSCNDFFKARLGSNSILGEMLDQSGYTTRIFSISWEISCRFFTKICKKSVSCQFFYGF